MVGCTYTYKDATVPTIVLAEYTRELCLVIYKALAGPPLKYRWAQHQIIG